MRASQWYDKLQRVWQKPRFTLIGLGLLAVFLMFVVSNWALLTNAALLNNEKVKLSFVVPNDEAQQWQSLIDEFETAHPAVEIDLVNLRDKDAIKPQDSRAVKKRYTDSFKYPEDPQNPHYDLVFMDVIWVPEFADKEWIRELPMQPPDPELKKFLSDDIKGGMYQKKLYRMPVRSDIGWLYYRTDLLKKAKLSPPKTFDDLKDISQKLQAKGLPWGYLWQGRQAEALSAMFVEVLHGHGGFWINEKLEVGLDRPEAIKAVQFLHDTMFDKPPISPETLTTYREDETLNLFLEGEGKAAFLRNWSYVLPKANLADSNIRNNIGVRPMVFESGRMGGGCQGGWGLGIAKKTQYPKEAWQAVQFFTSAAAQRKLFLAGSVGLPTRRDLFKDPQLVKRYSHYPAILDFFENQKPHQVVFRPAIPEYAKATCILQKYLHTALTQENRDIITKEMQNAAKDTKVLLKTIEGPPNETSCISGEP